MNLPRQINQNANVTNYYYRADGVKVKKKFVLTNAAGTKTINTEYLDGFQYSTPNTEPLRRALEKEDDATMAVATAGGEEAFSPDPDRMVVAKSDPGTSDLDNMTLSFFPTAEGYYDYENLRYIYQYKDHLGNVRVSYVQNSAGVLQVMDSNDYYPFGMSHLKNTQSVYDPMAIPYNYKYNGKELQEAGMYDYGARMYMADIGRWGVVDPLAEKTMEPYAYVYNNPVMMIDPTGMVGEGANDDIQTGVDGDTSLAFGVRASDVQKVSGMGGMNSYNYGDSTGTKAGSNKEEKSNTNPAAIHNAGVAALGNSLDKTINFETSALALPFGSISGRDNDVAVPDFDFYTIKGTINVRGDKVSVVAHGQSSNTNLSKIYYTGFVSINGSSPYGLSSFNSEKPFNSQKGVNDFQPSGYSYIGRTDFVIPSGTMIFNVNIKAGYVGSTNNDTALIVPFFPFGKASYNHTFSSGSGSSGINQYPIKK